MKVKSAII